jgi:hypothetical protein
MICTSALRCNQQFSVSFVSLIESHLCLIGYLLKGAASAYQPGAPAKKCFYQAFAQQNRSILRGSA